MGRWRRGGERSGWHDLVLMGSLLVLGTVLNFDLPDFPQKWRLIAPFDLARENNIAAWCSGIALLMVGLKAYQRFSAKHDPQRRAWLVFAFLFTGLAMDEIGSLHERLGSESMSHLWPVGIICILLFAYGFRALSSAGETRKSAGLLLAAFLLFGSVALQEFIEQSVTWPRWILGIRAGLEEGTELVGIFLALRAVHLVKGAPGYGSWKTIIPNPFEMHHLPALALGGLILHYAAAVRYASSLDDLALRGNPAVLYLMAGFFLLFAASFHAAIGEAGPRRRVWAGFSALFLICSMGAVVPLQRLIPWLGTWPPSGAEHAGHWLATVVPFLALASLVTFLQLQAGLKSARFKVTPALLVWAVPFMPDGADMAAKALPWALCLAVGLLLWQVAARDDERAAPHRP